MKNDKNSLNESLDKIKYLMEYDSEMTRIENEDPFLINEQDTEEINSGCPDSISIKEVTKIMRSMANKIKAMNTGLIRMYNGDKRAISIYRSIKYLSTKNSYNEDFDECLPAIETGKEIFKGVFRDWFSKGETLEEELQQLIKRPYFRRGATVQKYLRASVELLKPKSKAENQPSIDPKSDSVIDKKTIPGGETSGGYVLAQGTSEDPYKYGKSGSGIAQVQQNLGVVQDGKWGPKTDAKMKELAPQYANGFTKDDVLRVIQASRSKDRETAITPPYMKPRTKPLKGQLPSVASNPGLKLMNIAPNDATAKDAKQHWKDVRKQDRQER